MANPKGNPKNLKNFKKNDPRINRKGRPPILPELKETIEKIFNQEIKGVNVLEGIIKALAIKALKGDTKAAQELFDRYFGKVKQEIDQNIINDKPIIVKVNGKKLNL